MAGLDWEVCGTQLTNGKSKWLLLLSVRYGVSSTTTR